MREIVVNSFTNSDDALYWLECNIDDLVYQGYEDIKAEMTYVNGEWRVGVITDTAQGEFNFD